MTFRNDDVLQKLYKYEFDHTRIIHVWVGPREDLTKVIRKLPKCVYDILDSNDIFYYPALDMEDQIKPKPHGSYNLFHRSSNQFQLVSQGSLDYEFSKALLAYCVAEIIMLPRAAGGGEAFKIKDRIPVVVVCESAEWMSPVLLQHAEVIPVSDLLSV
jgi:hypothetical protein